MRRNQTMDMALDISNYLNEVYNDWEASRHKFLNNIYLQTYWPIPFFGNPRTAIVATVGVNPSSGEFKPERNWAAVQIKGDWKKRLKNYFINATPPHKWFDSWRKSLKFLDVSYEGGTAAHFDVSYRPSRAMLKNPRTNPEEFRRMVERDVVWFFRLLPLCPNLRLLLTFGPIVRKNGSTESLAQFLRNNAPKNGFTVSQDSKFWTLKHLDTGKRVCVHEVKRGLEL
jgi:hypothetical protein